MTWMTNFDKSLQQIPCNTTNDAQYSLAVNCTYCTTAYKNWLCAVTIPRCIDYSSQQSYTIPRAISQPFLNGTLGNTTQDPMFSAANQSIMYYNSSRNPAIDQSIVPGPYKELLPCGDLCYALVRGCPAAMGFACPYDPQGYNQSYGYPLMDGDFPQCNYPGKVFGVSSGSMLKPSRLVFLATIFAWYLAS
jgi:calcium channel MID1